MLKTCLSAFLAVALLGCQPMQRNTEQTPTARLAVRALEELGGCQALAQPGPFGTATLLDRAAQTPLTLNQVVAARLHEVSEVKFPLHPGKRQQPGERGGLIALAAPADGTYVLGSASVAWAELVDGDQNRVATPRSYEWVELCGRPMKAGIYELRAGGRYLVQLSASPDATVHLFFSGPLGSVLKLQ